MECKTPASSSKQEIITNFDVNYNVNYFLSSLSFDKQNKFVSLNSYNKRNL